MNIQNLVLDINKKPFQTITANTGEVASRFVRISMVDKSVPVDLTGVTVSLYAKKPDDTKVFNNVTIEDKKNGIILAELTSQILAVEGLVKLTLLLIKNNAKLCSKQFLLNVDKSIVDDEAVESTNEFGALTESLSKVEEWNGYFKETSGKIEEKYTERLNGFNSELEYIKDFKLSISVHDFLCDDGEYVKGDGVHDDTTGIRKALKYCHENNKKLTFTPGKVYMVGTCYLYEGIHIEGNGATLKMLPNSPKATRLLTMQNEYKYSSDVDSKVITISNLVFDGNCDNQGDYSNYQKEQQFGLFLEGDHLKAGKVRANINNCMFENFCGDGMHFYTNTYVNCNNIIAQRCFRGCVVVSGGNSIFNINNYLNISNMGLGLDLEIDVTGYNGAGIIANVSNVTTNRSCDFGNMKSTDNIINVSNLTSTKGRVNVTIFGDVTFSDCRFNRVEVVNSTNANFNNCIFNTEVDGNSLVGLTVRSIDSMTSRPRTDYNTHISNCVFKITGEKIEGTTHEGVHGYLTNIDIKNCTFEESLDRAIQLYGVSYGYVSNNMINAPLGTYYRGATWAANRTVHFKNNFYSDDTIPYMVSVGSIEGAKVVINETYYNNNHLQVTKTTSYGNFSTLINQRTLITDTDPTEIETFGWANDVCISSDRQKRWICTKTGTSTSSWVEF